MNELECCFNFTRLSLFFNRFFGHHDVEMTLILFAGRLGKSNVQSSSAACCAPLVFTPTLWNKIWENFKSCVCFKFFDFKTLLHLKSFNNRIGSFPSRKVMSLILGFSEVSHLGYLGIFSIRMSKQKLGILPIFLFFNL